jgi:lipopolysaccharide export system protein LptA
MDHLSAAHVDFAMLPERNLIREMTASGGVMAESRQGADSRSLKTSALRVVFSTGPSTPRDRRQQAHEASVPSAERQRIESVETLAPASIESRAGNETLSLTAKKFVAQFDSSGHLDKLFGHSGAEIHRQVAGGIPQSSSSAELAATFAADGQWDSLDQTGDVRFQQADRQATAAQAKMLRAGGMISLEGSPVLSDSMSRTTAFSVAINQQSGDLRAYGGVISTYLASASNSAVNLGSGPAHISADAVSGSMSSGHVLYEGHARLWQGESVLEAERIELWRDDKKMQATGRVVAVFPQAPGSGPSLPKAPGKSPPSPSSPTLWQIRAPGLTYWSNEGKAHLEGGVTAKSDQSSLESSTLDVFLVPGSSSDAQPGHSTSPTGASLAQPAGAPGQQLSRILAQGGVLVRQGDRRGTGEQAEYTAADEKFVLSGGQPTLTNGSSDTTTGRSLTFFVASDTILIDSQEGLRTLTKHRVEK